MFNLFIMWILFDKIIINSEIITLRFKINSFIFLFFIKSIWNLLNIRLKVIYFISLPHYRSFFKKLLLNTIKFLIEQIIFINLTWIIILIFHNLFSKLTWKFLLINNNIILLLVNSFLKTLWKDIFSYLYHFIHLINYLILFLNLLDFFLNYASKVFPYFWIMLIYLFLIHKRN